MLRAPVVLRLLSFAAACSLAACGGGGGGGTSATIPVAGNSTPPAPVGITTSAPQATAPTKLSIFVPRVNVTAARRRASVSPATKSVAISLVSVNGSPAPVPVSVNADLTATSPGCTATGPGLNCAVPINLPVGTDVVTVKTYSGTGQSGTLLGSAQSPVSVAQNATNALSVTLSGVVSALSVFMTQTAFSPQTPVSGVRVYPVALDAQGFVILNPGTYDNPLNVSIGDDGTTFLLKVNGVKATVTSGQQTAQITSPADVVTVDYLTTGKATGGTVAVASSVAPTTIFGSVGLTVGALSPLVVNNSSPTLTVNAIGAPTSLAVGGGKPPYTVTGSRGISASPTAGTGPFNVTTSAYDVGTVTVADSSGAKTTVAVVTNTPAITTTPSGGTFKATATAVTFPVTLGSQAYTLGGGSGTYAVSLASLGTIPGNAGNVAGFLVSGNTLTINALATGTDAIVITSGNQTAYIFVTVTPDAIVASVGASGFASYDGASTIYLSGGSAYQQSSATVTPVGGAAGSGQWSLNFSGGSCPSVNAVYQTKQRNYTLSPSGGSSFGTCTFTLSDNTNHTSGTYTVNVVAPIAVSGGTGSGQAFSFASTASKAVTMTISRPASGPSSAPVAAAASFAVSETGTAVVTLGGPAYSTVTPTSGTATATGGTAQIVLAPSLNGAALLTITDLATNISVPVAIGVGSNPLSVNPGTPNSAGLSASNGVTYVLVGVSYTGTISGGSGTYSVASATRNDASCANQVASVSGSTLNVGSTATTAQPCTYNVADTAGNVTQVVIQTVGQLQLVLPTTLPPTITTPPDMHGFAGNQLEFAGTNRQAQITIPIASLFVANLGSCATLNASSDNASVATVSGTNGSFVQTMSAGLGNDGSANCTLWVQANGAGYTRITVTDGGSPVSAVTRNAIGVGVTTVTIPVLNRNRAH